MLITKVHVEKFRGFHNQDFEVGSMLTAKLDRMEPKSQLFWEL